MTARWSRQRRPGWGAWPLLTLILLPPLAPAQADPPPPPAKPAALPPALQKVARQYDRAIATHKAGRYAEAVAAYEAFLRGAKAANVATPGLLPAYRNLAALYAFRGDRKAAESALRVVAENDPKDAAALARLATLAGESRRFKEAESCARRALALKPQGETLAQAHFALGLALAARKDDRGAERAFAESARLAPKNAQARLNHAFALARLGQARPALAQADRARELAPELVQAHLTAADLRARINDQPAAVLAYDAALKRDPDNAAALHGRAVALDKLGKKTEALTAFARAAQADPNNAPARLSLGSLYFGIRNYEAARLQYAAALKILPASQRAARAAALTGLGASELEAALSKTDRSAWETGVARAEARLKEALALEPANADARRALGYLYERANRYAQAEELYEARIAARPEDPEGYRGLARVHTMQRKTDAVLDTWRRYRKRRPDDPLSYSEAARFLEAAGRRDAAIAEWKLLLARAPNDAEALLGIADNLRLLNKLAEARAGYRLALAAAARQQDAPGANALQKAAGEQRRLETLRGLALNAQLDEKLDEAEQWWNAVKALEARRAERTGQPPSPATYRALAALYERQGKFDRAAQEFEALSDVSPNDPTPFADMARLLESQGKIEEAARAYRRGAERAPDPLEYRLQAAELFRRRQQFGRAVAEYEALRLDFPKERKFLPALAQAYAQAGQDAKALTVLDLLIKGDASPRVYEMEKARVLTRLRRWAEARALYEKALERDPTDYGLYPDVARLYTEEGSADGYLNWLRPRFERTPQNPVLMAAVLDEYGRRKDEAAGFAYVRQVAEKSGAASRSVLENLARQLAQRGRRDEALDLIRRIARENPKDINAQLALAAELDANGKPDEATALWESLLKTEVTKEQRVTARRQLAARYARINRADDAMAQYRLLLKDAPDDFSASAELARLLTVAGREEEAIPLYAGLSKQTVYPAPARAQFQERIGTLYEKMGRKSDAAAHFREALKLDPKNRPAQDALKRLEGKQPGP